MWSLWKVWGRWMAPPPSRWPIASTRRPTSKYQPCKYAKESFKKTYKNVERHLLSQVLHYYRSGTDVTAWWAAACNRERRVWTYVASLRHKGRADTQKDRISLVSNNRLVAAASTCFVTWCKKSCRQKVIKHFCSSHQFVIWLQTTWPIVTPGFLPPW